MSAPLLQTGGGSSSSLWSSLQNATADLTLANAGFNTTFGQTSSVLWKFSNTTAATVSVPQAAPQLILSGQYWATGAATGEDKWTIIQVLTAGLNGASQLQINHTGTTGTASVLVPGGSQTLPGLAVAAGIGIWNLGGSALGLASTSGAQAAISTTGLQMRNGDTLNWSASGTVGVSASDTYFGKVSSAPGVMKFSGGPLSSSANGQGQLIAGSVQLTAASSATISSVTPTLGSASTWGYKIVAKDINGQPTAVSAEVTTTTGAATLDATHFNTIAWAAVGGAFSYDIYRTTTATVPTTKGIIANVLSTAALSLQDKALAGDGSTAPTVNTSGSIAATTYIFNTHGTTTGFISADLQTINSSTPTNIGGVSNTGLWLFRDRSNGGTALVLFDNLGSITIVSQTGPTSFVTGAPTATQIQISQTSGQFALLGGSSRASVPVALVQVNIN